MPKSIRVALVNDYMIVLEGLRALLQSSDPRIDVVELDVKSDRGGGSTSRCSIPTGSSNLSARVRALSADASNGAIVVFSFSDRPQAVQPRHASRCPGFYLEGRSAPQIIEASKLPQRATVSF